MSLSTYEEVTGYIQSLDIDIENKFDSIKSKEELMAFKIELVGRFSKTNMTSSEVILTGLRRALLKWQYVAWLIASNTFEITKAPSGIYFELEEGLVKFDTGQITCYLCLCYYDRVFMSCGLCPLQQYTGHQCNRTYQKWVNECNPMPMINAIEKAIKHYEGKDI